MQTGTSAANLAHAVPLTGGAGLGHAHLGTVDFVLLGRLLLGSLPGIYLGVRRPSRPPRPASKLLFIGIRFAL